MHEKQTKIIIAALTYEREQGLATLLNAVEKLNIVSHIALELLIVDNSPSHSAKAQLTEYAKAFRFPMHIKNVTERGIAHARNQVLEHALKSDAEYLLMIDDDEYPSQNWVTEMINAFDKFGGHVVIGPVRPIFDKPPSPWMIAGKHFSFGGYQDGEVLREGNTSNAAVKLDFLRAHSVRFNRQFDFTGGEDTCFFHELLKVGARITFAQHAIVNETIVAHRSTISWLLKRWMRTGNTDAYIRLLNTENRLFIFMEGIMRTMIGTFLMIASIAPLIFGYTSKFFDHLRITSRGMGYIGASLRIQYNEYRDLNR